MNENEYWSKSAVKQRLKDYQADINHAQKIATHSEYEDDINLVKSMRLGLKIHRACCKIKMDALKRKKEMVLFNQED